MSRLCSQHRERKTSPTKAEGRQTRGLPTRCFCSSVRTSLRTLAHGMSSGHQMGLQLSLPQPGLPRPVEYFNISGMKARSCAWNKAHTVMFRDTALVVWRCTVQSYCTSVPVGTMNWKRLACPGQPNKSCTIFSRVSAEKSSLDYGTAEMK